MHHKAMLDVTYNPTNRATLVTRMLAHFTPDARIVVTAEGYEPQEFIVRFPEGETKMQLMLVMTADGLRLN